ncbi:putative vesicle-associated membrane protein 726 [Ananas comosus]|uniref:Putative vesicle-associated membrane protein 726 n=1 Tax=Ananas comosus TaxID=4615 RepID=A0A199UFH4_ANACO|nr:putative vesicle-associated membrane protein 726 [Ananas comosus]
MGQQSLIYSFVARGTVVLAEYTEFSGNFNTIAAQCLQKLPASNNKFTYNCDGHTFNYLVEDGFSELRSLSIALFLFDFALLIPFSAEIFVEMVGFGDLGRFLWVGIVNILERIVVLELLTCHENVTLSNAYCVVAVESVGRQIPIAFLERVKEDFTKRYGGGKAATAAASSLNRDFGSKLKEHMQYCVDHPEEISKLAKVKAQVSEVKGVMMENIEKVLDRGEKIELLVDKTENLRSQAQDFRQQGTKIRRKMLLQNMKIKLIVLGIIIALILIIILSVCHGFKC